MTRALTLDSTIIDLLQRLEIDGQHVRIHTKVDRPTYERLNKVLVAIGGRWNGAKSIRAHVFETDPAALITEIVATGAVPSTRTPAQREGFFETSASLAAQLVWWANVRPGDNVLEPSAGRGRIIDAILAAGATCVAVERNERRWEYLCTTYQGTAAISDVRLLDERDFQDVTPASLSAPIDAVAMNPPFLKTAGSKGDHLDHVMHAHSLLRSGGHLAAILPNGVGFRTDRRHAAFRAWVTAAGGRIAEGLIPENAFKESGTSVRTCVLLLEKR